MQHCSDVKRHKNKRTCWIKSLLTTGIKPKIELIDEVNEENASLKEIHYIKLFKSFGANLVNDTIGGEGVKGYIATNECKRKISEAMKNRCFSEEHRKNLSLSNSRRWKNGFKISDKVREKMYKSCRRKPVLMYDMNMNFIKRFDGIRICERETGLKSCLISRVCLGKAKHTSGYILKFE
jgi:hypothetical protein